MTYTINGQLEIDAERGVVYFHAAEGRFTGMSLLRISQLPTPIPTDMQLDVTHGHGTNWKGRDGDGILAADPDRKQRRLRWRRNKKENRAKTFIVVRQKNCYRVEGGNAYRYVRILPDGTSTCTCGNAPSCAHVLAVGKFLAG